VIRFHCPSPPTLPKVTWVSKKNKTLSPIS